MFLFQNNNIMHLFTARELFLHVTHACVTRGMPKKQDYLIRIMPIYEYMIQIGNAFTYTQTLKTKNGYIIKYNKVL